MRFIEAKKQFEIRYYLWATSEFEREIDESLPTFRLFKTGTVWETFHFLQLLDRTRQKTLAHALLKRFHPDAVKALNETTSSEELAIRSARDKFHDVLTSYQVLRQFEAKGQIAEAQFWLNSIPRGPINFLDGLTYADDKNLRSRLDTLLGSIPASLEEEIDRKKKAGEKIKFIGKRKLLKLVAERFKNAFALRGAIESARVLDGDPYLSLDVPCGDWILTTHFWFGRGSSLLDYSHSIASTTIVEHEGQGGRFMGPLVIARLISFASWLGLTSQTQWECLTDDQVGLACDAAMNLCNHFFALAPKLLKGFEFGSLEVEVHKC